MENKIEAIGQPEVSILKLAKGNPFEFKAKVAVLPEVRLPDYKKIALEVKRNKILVEDGEVEEALSWLQKSRARFSQKSGPCVIGDWVELRLKIKGESLSEPEIKDGFILGQGKLIPGLEEKIEGMLAGQEKRFSLSLPQNYFREDLAGEKADFEVNLQSVQKVELPEVNDNFAQGLGDFRDLAAFKKSLKDGINLEKEAAESQRVRQKILEKIAEKSEMETPAVLINNVKAQMLVNLKQDVSQKLGISFETYLQKLNKTEKDLLDSFVIEAEKRVRNSLVLGEISKKEKIEVSDGEVKEEMDKFLKNIAPEKLKELDSERLRNYTEDVIKNEKTLKFLESFSQ